MSLRHRITALGLTTALTLTACGGTLTPAEPVKDVPDDQLKGEVTVWSWDVAATALTRLAKRFEDQHPEVSVNVVDVGYDNAADKLSVGLKSGTGLPDVVTVETEQMQTYIGRFPEGFRSMTEAANDFEADMDPSKLTAGSNADGELFGLPWDSGTAGLFYRTDYFDEAGVDPDSIETWDDLIAAGRDVKEATGKQLLVSDVSGSSSLVPILLQQQGIGYFDDGDITLDSPEAREALDAVTELNDAGLIRNEKGWDALVRAHKEGDVAAAISGVWWAGTLTDEMPELEGRFGVMPLPTLGESTARTSNEGGSGLAIPAQSDNPDAAWAFTKFALTDTDNQVSMMEEEGLFPSYLPALEDPYFTQRQEYFGGQRIYEWFGEQTADIPAIEYTEDFSQADQSMSEVVPGVVLNGEDPDTALADAAELLAGTTGRKQGSR